MYAHHAHILRSVPNGRVSVDCPRLQMVELGWRRGLPSRAHVPNHWISSGLLRKRGQGLAEREGREAAHLVPQPWDEQKAGDWQREDRLARRQRVENAMKSRYPLSWACRFLTAVSYRLFSPEKGFVLKHSLQRVNTLNLSGEYRTTSRG